MSKSLPQLNETQAKAFNIFDGTKAFARKEEFQRSGLDYEELTNQLIDLGYLTKNKAGAVSVSKEAKRANQAAARRYRFAVAGLDN